MKRLTIRQLKIAFIMIITFCALSFTYNTNLKIRTGSVVQITSECIGCIDEETLDKAIKYANEKNTAMFTSIAKSKSSVILPKGTKAEVLRIRIGKVRIKLNDGRMVWVKYNSVKPSK